MDFTEEEAKDKLEELGFKVMLATDMEFLGYSIEPNGEGWGVYELYQPKGTFDRIARSLSGKLATQRTAVVWLLDYLAA